MTITHESNTESAMPAGIVQDRLAHVSAAAYRIRHHALNMGEVQGQGYVGQALGAADMLATVYGDQLRFQTTPGDEATLKVSTKGGTTIFDMTTKAGASTHVTVDLVGLEEGVDYFFA